MAGERSIREPVHLVLTVNLADGSLPLRFGPEEAEVDGILVSASFETAMPGGFGPGDFKVTRPDDFDPLSLGRGLWASVTLADSSGRNVYEGRIDGTPKTGVNELEIQTEGHAKVAEDNETARVIFRDIDLSHWRGPSVQRKINLLAAGISPVDPQVQADKSSGAPSLVCEVMSPWAGTSLPICEALYDAAGLPIGSLYYAWKKGPNLTAGPDVWDWRATLSTDDLASATDTTGDLQAAGPGTGTLTATGAPKLFAQLWLLFGAGAVAADNVQYNVFWTTLAVYGLTGLTKRGTEPAAGFFVSDMLTYVLGAFCSQLRVNADSIEPTTFIVPQMEFLEDTTPRAMLEAMLLLGGSSTYPLDWMVYDDRAVRVASPGSYGTVWNLRRDEGSPPDNAGPDASQRPNAVKVRWDDGSGTIRTVGPAGLGADFTDSTLIVSDPTHPANVAGLTMWKVIDVGVSTLAGAVLLGQMYLADKNRQEWRGSISAQGEDGFIRDSAQNEQPVYMIRSGDRAVLGDDNDTRERRIVGTSYDHASRSTKIDIGPKPGYFDTLLARAGVVVDPLTYPAPAASTNGRGGTAFREPISHDLTFGGGSKKRTTFGKKVGLGTKKRKK